MKLIFEFENTLKSEYISDIISGSHDLFNSLIDLNIADLNITEYNRRYFGNLISTQDRILSNIYRYAFIIDRSLIGYNKNLQDLCFVDYGGGHGFLSLLARAVGFGKVIHTDIYNKSCYDAKTIASEINLTADHYIPGDVDEVVEYIGENNIAINIIANYDVLEHIYNLKYFFSKLIEIKQAFNLFFASGANQNNPYINSILKKQHKNFEFNKRKFKIGRKETDTIEPLFELRKRIINEKYPNINDEDLEMLADRTRGLLVANIEMAAKNFVENRIIPKKMKHPTNTCDPYTGNWFEHLIDHKELKVILDSLGYKAKIVNGYYFYGNNDKKKYIKKFLNLLINFSGRYSINISPLFCLDVKYDNRKKS